MEVCRTMGGGGDDMVVPEASWSLPFLVGGVVFAGALGLQRNGFHVGFRRINGSVN